MARIKPIIGTWYQDQGSGQKFEVVAMDGDSIELQHIDGEIEELDLDSWLERPIGRIAPPEDWTAPYELEGDDQFGSENNSSYNWTDPLDNIEADAIEIDIDEFDND